VTSPLDGLHDFYEPPPPSWMPQTIGWYVVFVLLALAAIWCAIRVVRHWFANRYRREALRELATLAPDQFSTLLKRVALAAWPRERVASLNGEAWLAFLNETSGKDAFRQAPGNRIEELALRPATTLSADDMQRLRQIAADWIRGHHVQA
jgi:Domain of unknown function (DUF4381)